MHIFVAFRSPNLLDRRQDLLDPLFITISDVPVQEETNVVRNVDIRDLAHDNLTEEDDCIKLYRAKMLKDCPDILDYMTVRSTSQQ